MRLRTSWFDKNLASWTTDRFTFDKTVVRYMTDVGGVDAVRAVQDILPPAVRDVFVVVTHLGDPVLLGLLVVGFYYTRRDETGGFVFGLATGAVGLTAGLKGAIARPRPPTGLHAVAESGYALPSGHALGSTVVLFALAETVDVASRRVRYAVAAVTVGLVALSRVAIGVHFPVDVVAGVAVGGVYLAVVSYDGYDAEIAFSAAVTVATIGVALGSEYRLAEAVGIPLGGYVAYHAVADRYDFADLLTDGDAVLVALLPAVALGMVLPAGTATLAETGVYATATAGVFLAPHAMERVRQWL
jgi:membrane-associated phospholipid phosphatase